MRNKDCSQQWWDYALSEFIYLIINDPAICKVQTSPKSKLAPCNMWYSNIALIRKNNQLSFVSHMFFQNSAKTILEVKLTLWTSTELRILSIQLTWFWYHPECFMIIFFRDALRIFTISWQAGIKMFKNRQTWEGLTGLLTNWIIIKRSLYYRKK